MPKTPPIVHSAAVCREPYCSSSSKTRSGQDSSGSRTGDPVGKKSFAPQSEVPPKCRRFSGGSRRITFEITSSVSVKEFMLRSSSCRQVLCSSASTNDWIWLSLEGDTRSGQ